ncbi:MAG: acetylornithine deacetylase/succinyl-diaminopimelate desuccinylase family protein [Granulosicoccus sp.]|jgi:acetylornithine deacetylase/succinyl-diaminopimelate desuccinylase family protein
MTSSHDYDVDETRLVDDLVAMVRIPSVNTFGLAQQDVPAEEGMAVYFEKRLCELGLPVQSHDVENGRRNVWGTLKGTGHGPTILLAGHFDTVGIIAYDDPFSGDVKNGNVYGRGSCDMKAGLAAYLEVVRLLQQSDQPLLGDLVIAGIVDEEHAMIGSAEFGRTGPRVDYAIVAEPSGLNISAAHKGQVCLSITTKGKSVHSSMPQLGINAIYHMNAVITELQQYAKELELRPAHPVCGNPSFSLGVINGGQNASSVPDFCEITIDRRTIPGESYESVMAELNAILEKVSSQTPEFHYAFSEPTLNVPPLSTSMESDVFKSVFAACEDVLGRAPEVTPFPGSTDAPNFGVPAVICGAGALAQAHSLNEYVPVAEMVSAVKIYFQAIQSMQVMQRDND